jgi:hypothetical protein
MRKIGLMKSKASEAAAMSKPLFRVPPVGGTAPDSTALKKVEVADFVADFIESLHFFWTIARMRSGTRAQHPTTSVWSEFVSPAKISPRERFCGVSCRKVRDWPKVMAIAGTK